jgi:hypothetical protein
VERARYEAERAERQYRAVEPENRLGARGLETEWEKRLRDLATKSFGATRGRGSEGKTGSFGVLVFKRVKYGSTRITVFPSVISHPAVPK